MNIFVFDAAPEEAAAGVSSRHLLAVVENGLALLSTYACTHAGLRRYYDSALDVWNGWPMTFRQASMDMRMLTYMRWLETAGALAWLVRYVCVLMRRERKYRAFFSKHAWDRFAWSVLEHAEMGASSDMVGTDPERFVVCVTSDVAEALGCMAQEAFIASAQIAVRAYRLHAVTALREEMVWGADSPIWWASARAEAERLGLIRRHGGDRTVVMDCPFCGRAVAVPVSALRDGVEVACGCGATYATCRRERWCAPLAAARSTT